MKNFICRLVSHICVFCNIILAFGAKPNARTIYTKLSASLMVENPFDILRTYGVKLFNARLYFILKS